MDPLVHLRRMLARRPWLYWVGVAAGATMITHVVLAQVAGVEATRRLWGETQRVAVAGADLPVGSPPQAVEWRDIPVAVAPAAAVTDAAEVAGAVLVHPVGRGEILTTADLTAPGPRGRIEAGTVGVTIEVVPAGAPIGLGDPVAVASGGILLAAAATVVATDGPVAVVAVPIDEAAAVAAAAANGDASLLLLP